MCNFYTPTLQITGIERNADGKVNIFFKVYNQSIIIPAEEAEVIFNKLSSVELSKLIGYPVGERFETKSEMCFSVIF